MTQPPTFSYRGRDLIAPLEQMLASLDAEIAKVRADLDKVDPGTKPLARPGDAIAPETPARKLQRELARLTNERTDGALWLQECRRTRWAKWVLDFAQLRTIYREPV